jgi:large repetitive protein
MTSNDFDPVIDDLIIAKPRKEIVFIEDNVADIGTLIKGIGGSKEIIVLDSTQDGLHQMAQALAGRSGIDALHIISHGAAGTLNLGALTLDANGLEARHDELQAIGQSLREGGDILLYGCNVGADDGAGQGGSFVEHLAIATGADVAASNNPTGSLDLGGDWNLEVTSGQVETAAVVDAKTAALYHGMLAGIQNKTVTFTNFGNFINPPTSVDDGANADVVYKVGGLDAYRLVIDASKTAVVAYAYGAATYVNVAGQAQLTENSVTISFQAGQVFTLTSLDVATMSNTVSENLIFTAVDSNNQVHTQTAFLPATYNTSVTVSFPGFTNIKKLTITTPDNGGIFKFFSLDNLVFGDVHQAVVVPTISSVSSNTANGTYKAGDVIRLTVSFDQSVTVDASGGTPTITLETGAIDRTAVYTGGSGTSTLFFDYTVQAGDNSADLDYVSSGALALNGGTIKASSGGSNATLTLPAPGGIGSLGANKAIVIDTTPPTAPSVPVLDPAFDKGSSNSDNITNLTQLKFSGTVSDSSAVTVKLYDGATEVGSGAVSAGTYVITTTGSLSQGTHTITAKAFDAVGNASTASGGIVVTIDTTAPGVTVTSSQPVLKSGETAIITFTFTEDPGTSFNSDSVSVSGGTLGPIDGSSGLTRTATFTPSANVNDGTGSVSVKAGSYQDVAGNTGGAGSLAVPISYDTLPPALTITSDKAALKIGETATITFTFSEDPGTSFSWDGAHGSVTVGGGTLSAISGTGLTRSAIFTPTAGTDGGTASITVAAGQYHDAAGNAGTAGATPSISFDTLAPNAPGAPVLASSDDSGASNSDNVTNKTSLTFTGSADDGTTVKLYDGGVEVGHATASGGRYSILVNNLGEGAHSLNTVAFDAAGNASTASGALAVTVDLTPPSTTVAGAALSNDTGASSSDMVTSQANQIISGTLGANLAAGEQVMVSLDNGGSWRLATASVGSNTWSLPATLVGSNTLKVQVVDLAGNGGVVYSHAYVLDTVAPGAPSTPDLDAASDSGSSSTDNITGVTRPSFSGTAEIGAIVRLYDGATEIGHATASDGTWQITSGIALADGSHSITATATDLAGNVSNASAALTVQILSVGPATTVQSMALSNDTGVDGDFITKESAQTISGILSANLAAGERVQVSLDGGHVWNDATSTAGSSAWSIAATLAAGSHEIQVRVIDAVDNAGPVHTQAYTLDTTAPSLTITSDKAALKIGETATITFTFSEDPGTSFSWDGAHGGVTVGGGTLSALSGTGLTRSAIFTPTAGTDGGTASITVAAGQYHDVAGNAGTAGATPSISFDTLAPNAPSAPDLDRNSDKGASDSDKLTNLTSLVFKGTAEAGATVTLYDSDGTTVIGSGTATGGNWTITTSTLGEGSHAVSARASDAAGNVSAVSGATTVTIDTTRPALAITSNVSRLKIGETAVITFTFSEDPGSSFGWNGSSGSLAVSGGTLSAISGSGLVRTAIFTPAANTDAGTASIVVNNDAYQDAAGNGGAGAVSPSLHFDTLAPAAPAAPLLQAASDTGAKGDGLTETSMPVIEGTALANTLVTLYETVGTGKVKIGAAMADASGTWSIATGLSIGVHALSATQTDAAGNESAASATFTLRIVEPPVPVELIDGMPVTIQPVSLPGGVNGSAVSVPIVGSGRVESSGSAGVADIPLASSGQGGTLLLAQLAPGYGLSASGANLPAASAGELLLAAIKAATPTHAAADQGHLTGNGQSFLDGLAAGGSLLVETVKPVSSGAPDGVLTLSGPASGTGQSTALVIDAGGLAAGSTIALQQVNFAAVLGSANVAAQSGMMLTGDAAGQHFTVAAGGSTSVFAGGGNDVLSVAAVAQGARPAAGVTLLHGGTENDIVTFSGARADYDIAFHNGYVMVSSKAAPDAKAMLVNVEQLQFSDGGVTVQNSVDMNILAGMYQTVLGRQADVMGIEYWANVHQGGASWGAIALSMISSKEHVAGHDGFNGVAAHDVVLLYTAIFNRDADAGGLAYWTAAMSHGATLEQVASSFVQSVEMVGHQRAATDWDFSLG